MKNVVGPLLCVWVWACWNATSLGADPGNAGTSRTDAADDQSIAVHHFFRPNTPDESITGQLIELMRKDPSIKLEQWGGIALPGGFGRSSLMMAFAGGTAPDIMLTFFHTIRSDFGQGFLYPLNEWIGDDTDGDGLVSPEEAKWDGWRKIPPLWRMVSTVNGKIYALPVADTVSVGILFRKDLVQRVGLDPSRPPETWDDFYYWCQKLTYPNKDIPGSPLKKGQKGYRASTIGWLWLPWIQSAGGSPIVQFRRSPTTGKEYEFPMDEMIFAAPDTGENLNHVTSRWSANFSCQAGIDSCAFFNKLAWAPWIADAETGEPVNLTEQNLQDGLVSFRGREIRFTPEEVVKGVIRESGASAMTMEDMLGRGEVAMLQWFDREIETFTKTIGLPPDVLAMFPVPGKDGSHKPALQVQRHFSAITSSGGATSKARRDKMWKCLTAITSEETRDIQIQKKAITGNAMWCRPADLERLGFSEYINEIPPSMKDLYKRMDNGEIYLGTEPFMGSWESVCSLLQNNVLGLIFSTLGKEFDYTAALKEADFEANRGVMFQQPKLELDKHRPTARVIFGIFLIVVVVCIYLIAKDKYVTPTGSTGSVRSRLMPWIMLGPALISIGVWSYYPLLRGLFMAFQDYNILRDSKWIGLDNFIAVAIDANTWLYAMKTVKFVIITIAISFLTPIALALLLTEIPQGKVFFRTMYFLPQMSSGIVIALMWMMMYNPTEIGALNQVLAIFHIQPQTWLSDPFWAMFCCVLPGVWAGAGMGSLIYIAALKSFPDDYYEAAALDGAGFIKRIQHIVMPQLMPLIIINFVGAFIGAFQGMGSIFLLTFGGPGKETNVISLAIWKLAYNDLRFGAATAMAWYMGVALIAFTYLQIRFLRKVEFRKAEED